MDSAIIKSFDACDEQHSFRGHGHVDVIKLGDRAVGRMVLEPGWRWSQDVRPADGGDQCMVPHLFLITEGQLHVRMEDGREFDLHPGDVAAIPPGHDGWVIGDRTCVALDFEGMGQILDELTPSARAGAPSQAEGVPLH